MLETLRVILTSSIFSIVLIIISAPAYSGSNLAYLSRMKARKKPEPQFEKVGGLRDQTITDKQSNTLNYDVHSFEREYSQEVRFRPLSMKNRTNILGLEPGKMPYGLVGSTYTKNIVQRNYGKRALFYSGSDKKRLEYKEKVSLPAALVGYSGGEKLAKPDGAVVAVCDGIPGDLSGLEDRQKEERRKANFAFSQKFCREAADKISRYTDPEKLEVDLPGIATSLRAAQGKENTTLTLGKAFRKKDGGYTYIGYNLGQSGVIAVLPKSDRKVVTVSPPSSEMDGIRGGLASKAKVELPEGTVLVGVTRGAYENLGLKAGKENHQLEITGSELTKTLRTERLVTPQVVVDSIKKVTVEKEKEKNAALQKLWEKRSTLQGEIANAEEELKKLACTGDPNCVTNRVKRQDYETEEKSWKEALDGVEKRIRDIEEQGSDFAAVGITLP